MFAECTLQYDTKKWGDIYVFVEKQILETLKVPSKICSRQHPIFFYYFSEKTSLDNSCESSALQMIYMKCQDLFISENKKKKFLSAAVGMAL